MLAPATDCAVRRRAAWVALADAWCARMTAATPLTNGVAMDVPSSVPSPAVPFGHSVVGYCGAVDHTSTPGAATSLGPPQFVNEAGCRLLSTAATVITGTPALYT